MLNRLTGLSKLTDLNEYDLSNLINELTAQLFPINYSTQSSLIIKLCAMRHALCAMPSAPCSMRSALSSRNAHPDSLLFRLINPKSEICNPQLKIPHPATRIAQLATRTPQRVTRLTNPAYEKLIERPGTADILSFPVTGYYPSWSVPPSLL